MRHKEAIHSGHFMMSNFEAEEAEDDDDITSNDDQSGGKGNLILKSDDVSDIVNPEPDRNEPQVPNRLRSVIDMSLNQLFKRMSIVYRHKLTSPKWNKFWGLKLRWKDKIRLNNVIWRCWHMQFCKGMSKYGLCAFASPVEIDNHNCCEGGTLLEGKYWKRKLQVITKEYTKWRRFYKNRGENVADMTTEEWESVFANNQLTILEGSKDDANLSYITGADEFLYDAFLNSITGSNGPGCSFGSTSNSNALGAVAWPNPREMYKNTTNADIIQPDLFQLNPNIDDLLDLDPNNWLSEPRLSTIQEAVGPLHSQQLQQQEAMDSYIGPSIQPQLMNDPTVVSVTVAQPVSLNTIQQNQAEFQTQQQIQLSPVMQATCSSTSSRRNSPKPKILHQRSDEVVSKPSVRSAPYTIPSSCNASASAGFLEPPKAKVRCHSGPPSHSNMQYVSQPTSSSNAAFSANSELVELLRTNKSVHEVHREQQRRHNKSESRAPHKPIQSSNSTTRHNETTPPQRLVEVPPVPNNAIPQPSLNMAGSCRNQRRQEVHISSESHRRTNIKSGFDLMRSLIPSLKDNEGVKISKAALLHKGGDYLKELMRDKVKLSHSIETNKREIEQLREEIKHCHNAMGSDGASGLEGGAQGTKEAYDQMFSHHVRECTLKNWQYWVFSKLMDPLFDSYVASVSTKSRNDLTRSSMSWLDQHCSLTQMRPLALEALKDLATGTDILVDPASIAQTAVDAVNKRDPEEGMDQS